MSAADKPFDHVAGQHIAAALGLRGHTPDGEMVVLTERERAEIQGAITRCSCALRLPADFERVGDDGAIAAILDIVIGELERLDARIDRVTLAKAGRLFDTTPAPLEVPHGR